MSLYWSDLPISKYEDYRRYCTINVEYNIYYMWFQSSIYRASLARPYDRKIALRGWWCFCGKWCIYNGVRVIARGKSTCRCTLRFFFNSYLDNPKAVALTRTRIFMSVNRRDGSFINHPPYPMICPNVYKVYMQIREPFQGL